MVTVTTRDENSIKLAINALISQHGEPDDIYFDKESTMIHITKPEQLKLNLDSIYNIYSHKSFGLEESRMRKVHKMVGKRSLSNSYLEIAEFSIQMHICQYYTNLIPYGIVGIGTCSTPEIEDIRTTSKRPSGFA